MRSLAGRSAEAAKEIKNLISDSVERVTQGTALVDKAGATMSEVVSAIRRVTDIMGEISAASNEQSQGVAQIGEAVTQMDQATQQNAALVEEMAAAASSLRGQADELVQAVAVFKLGHGDGHVATPKPGSQPRQDQITHSDSPAPKHLSAPPKSKSIGPPKPAPKPAPKLSAPPRAPKMAVASAGASDEWESF